jgi:hypothetical protein
MKNNPNHIPDQFPTFLSWAWDELRTAVKGWFAKPQPKIRRKVA